MMSTRQKARFAIIAMAWTIISCCLSVATALDTNGVLRFNKEHIFKIVQFTDIHWKNGEPNDIKNQQLMSAILDAESPDLVVLTGDVIVGRDCSNPKEGFAGCILPMIDRKIPWAFVFGNHDDEGTMSRLELMDLLVRMPYSLCKAGPKEIQGVSNYVLRIYSGEPNKPRRILYFLDSNGYTQTKVGKYDWIRPNQIAWYRKTSTEYKTLNGNEPIPSLAFFHIPIPEFNVTQENGSYRGHKLESVASPKINSGFFAAALEQGDIQGIFVGHDHANDYEIRLCGIRLCYGRKTGYESYSIERYSESITDKERLAWRGARVILLKEQQKEFQTWIRTADNQVIKYD
jgi:predicted MPP superfamily phosphohydrolase